jgi:hypothetical protein
VRFVLQTDIDYAVQGHAMQGQAAVGGRSHGAHGALCLRDAGSAKQGAQQKHSRKRAASPLGGNSGCRLIEGRVRFIHRYAPMHEYESGSGFSLCDLENIFLCGQSAVKLFDVSF